MNGSVDESIINENSFSPAANVAIVVSEGVAVIRLITVVPVV